RATACRHLWRASLECCSYPYAEDWGQSSVQPKLAGQSYSSRSPRPEAVAHRNQQQLAADSQNQSENLLKSRLHHQPAIPSAQRNHLQCGLLIAHRAVQRTLGLETQTPPAALHLAARQMREQTAVFPTKIAAAHLQTFPASATDWDSTCSTARAEFGSKDQLAEGPARRVRGSCGLDTHRP